MNTPTRHDTRSRTRCDQHSSSTEAEIRWRDQLPADWADAVDPPLHFRHYREYEISAERSVGYDEDEQPCFITHRFALTRLVSDDDEEFYETVTLSEEMTAWRLRDGRWLVLRKTHPGTCQANRGFYAISPDMPR
jgi:hypothetical protein